MVSITSGSGKSNAILNFVYECCGMSVSMGHSTVCKYYSDTFERTGDSDASSYQIIKPTNVNFNGYNKWLSLV